MFPIFSKIPVAFAFAQPMDVKDTRRGINKIRSQSGSRDWHHSRTDRFYRTKMPGLTYAFYAAMGGFVPEVETMNQEVSY